MINIILSYKYKMKILLLIICLLSCVGCGVKENIENKVDPVTTINPSPKASNSPVVEACKQRIDYLDVMMENGFYTEDNIVYKRKGESGKIEHTFNVETFELIGPYESNINGYTYAIKNNTIDFQGCIISLDQMTFSGNNCSELENNPYFSDSIYSIQTFIAYYLFECEDIVEFSKISLNDLQMLFSVYYEK